VALGQREDGEALGDRVLEPEGEFGGLVAVAFHQARQLGLGGLEVGGVPDPAQLLSDTLADGEIGGVVDGVLGQMELAALPRTASASRLETPLTYISATASMTARQERRPRSKALG
jgi:hypothetical protein